MQTSRIITRINCIARPRERRLAHTSISSHHPHSVLTSASPCSSVSLCLHLHTHRAPCAPACLLLLSRGPARIYICKLAQLMRRMSELQRSCTGARERKRESMTDEQKDQRQSLRDLCELEGRSAARVGEAGASDASTAALGTHVAPAGQAGGVQRRAALCEGVGAGEQRSTAIGQASA
jgi:hypothetical protein